MTEHEYTAKIGQDLLNKLSDSLKQGKWRPHKTLLNYLGIPLEDIQRRTRLFHQSFTVKDPAFPRAYMFVKIVHNKQEVEILIVGDIDVSITIVIGVPDGNAETVCSWDV